jgi:predicted nucleotidyltransferase
MNHKEKFKKEVERCIQKITKEYKPEKIYIFGSYASGKITADSDVDFFIEKKTTKPRIERQREVSRILIDRKIPIDIIVFTPSETKKRISLGDRFISEIVSPANLMYEKKQ